jgi:hypothetical protein
MLILAISQNLTRFLSCVTKILLKLSVLSKIISSSFIVNFLMERISNNYINLSKKKIKNFKNN